ncbi:hypothetical protein DFA_04334 [Cavenderia fasciculata]|uniref:Ankyrin repeat-containing protein n=1 Tax=Cavenderia fasciculata TaxID=261658 RepID=F4PPA3_CACFS|nr:uncharacterized protein DFA_04334 [Cavenderia fasciculata]EGG22216.1 hypothetical protein DFA_04334 [Cavenderia fasciculata]|eukprot:XP_004360067.1 hypothetical protein DFA_04334 [Cavenderia fasciculata]
MTTTTTTVITTTITFQSIFRAKYIRQLIFNQIDDIQKQLLYRPNAQAIYFNYNSDGRRRSLVVRTPLKGRDIIKLPRLEMISKYAMPWEFLCHYLPKDCNQILLNRRRLAITQYCCHRNATLDTLKHLLKWSTDFEFKWKYLNDADIEGEDNRLKFNQDVLEYLIKISPKKNGFLDKAMDVAIKNRYRVSIVKLLHSIKGVKLNSNHFYLACKSSSIEIVKYIHDSGVGECKNAMDIAAFNSLEIVKFLHLNRSEGATTNAMENAAKCGNIDVVKFLHENRSEGASTMAMDYASMYGYFEIVKYLHEHRSEGATTMAIEYAAQHGHIDIVKFIHQNLCEGIATNAIRYAVRYGHFEIFKYLYKTDHQTTKDIHIDDGAIVKGDMEMVTYLVETVNAKCTSETVRTALQFGKLDIFYYLYDRFSADSSIWTSNIMVEAATQGHIEIVKFLHFNKPDLDVTTWAMDLAAQNGHIEIVKFLSEHRSEGCTTEAIDRASMKGHIDMVKFLHYNRTEGSRKALQYACLFGHVEVSSFLINVRNEKCNQKIMLEVLSGHYDDIVKLILPQLLGEEGIEATQRAIKHLKHRSCYETKQLLIDHLKLLNGSSVDNQKRNNYNNNNPFKNLIDWIKSPKDNKTKK